MITLQIPVLTYIPLTNSLKGFVSSVRPKFYTLTVCSSVMKERKRIRVIARLSTMESSTVRMPNTCTSRITWSSLPASSPGRSPISWEGRVLYHQDFISLPNLSTKNDWSLRPLILSLMVAYMKECFGVTFH